MKGIIIIALALVMGCMGSVKAIGIKLYVGSVSIAAEDTKATYYLQLVLCNNMADTIYIPAQQVERLQPSITSDVSLLTEGGSYTMLTNVPGLVNDMNELSSVIPSPGKYKAPVITELDKKRLAENALLPHKEMNGVSCYVFAPNQCLTIHSLMLTFPPEFLKLGKITTQEADQVEAYLVMPVEYFTNRNTTGKDVLLISRASEDLKNNILVSAGKK